MLGGAFVWVLGGVVLVWTIFPFYWAALYSIKPDRLTFATLLIPVRQFAPTLEHWRWEWQHRFLVDGLGTAWSHSAIVAIGTVAVSLLLGLCAAVGLYRMRDQKLPVWPLLLLFVLPRVVPPITLLSPYALLMRVTRLSDSFTALILIHATIALPLSVLLLDSALRDLPADLIDAARLDGANWWRILWQLIVPLTMPMLFAAGVLAFALSWNEYLFALVNHSTRVTTAPVTIALMDRKDGVDFDQVGSHLVLVILPPVLLALAAQRYLVRGLTLGAVQG